MNFLRNFTMLEGFICIGRIEKLSQKQLPDVLYNKRCFRSFAKFTGKHPCQSLFLNKVAAPIYRIPPDDCFYCLRICWPTFLTVSTVNSFEKRINPLLPSVTFLYPLAVFGSLHTKNEVYHEGFLQKMWFGHIYWKKPYRKTSLFVQWTFSEV